MVVAARHLLAGVDDPDHEALGGEVLGGPGALALDAGRVVDVDRRSGAGATVSFSPSAPFVGGGGQGCSSARAAQIASALGWSVTIVAPSPLGSHGQGDEGDVLRPQSGHAGRQGDQAVGVGQGLVRGDRLRRLVEHPPDAQRVGQQPGAGDLLDQRRQEDLLPVDPADVRAVADVVPDADEGQRVLAADPRPPGGQVHAGLGVLQRAGQAHLDPAEGVDRLLEAVEVQDDEVVDGQAGHRLDGLHGAPGAAAVERDVEPVADGRQHLCRRRPCRTGGRRPCRAGCSRPRPTPGRGTRAAAWWCRTGRPRSCRSPCCPCRCAGRSP